MLRQITFAAESDAGKVGTYGMADARGAFKYDPLAKLSSKRQLDANAVKLPGLLEPKVV